MAARCSILELISEEALSPSTCMPASTSQEYMVPCQLMSVSICVGSEFRKLTCICFPMHICNGVSSTLKSTFLAGKSLYEPGSWFILTLVQIELLCEDSALGSHYSQIWSYNG